MNTEVSTAVVTVVSCSHLARARTLANSLREHEPYIPMFACVTDRPPDDFDAGAEPFELLHADELGVEDWRRFTFQYDAMELCCWAKPVAVQHLLETQDFERVIYLDADFLVCAPLTSVLSQLDEGDIVLTPHLRAPLPEDDMEPNELIVRRTGAINTGQIAVQRSANAIAFLTWWRSKAKRQFVIDVHAGLFVDQAWMDLAPGLFDRVKIDRTLGHNAAFWNIQSSCIDRAADNSLRIDGELLVTFHFSGFDPDCPDVLSRHQDPRILANHLVLAELAREYAQHLKANGHDACASLEYGYSRLSDGTKIKAHWREAIRLDDPMLSDVADPFDVQATPDLESRYRTAATTVRPSRVDWILAERNLRGRKRLEAQYSRILGEIARLWRKIGLRLRVS